MKPILRTFNYIGGISMTSADAKACTHIGPCDADVLRVSQKPYMAKQLAKIDPEMLRRELYDYGAWSDTQLSNHADNLQRIVWIAAGDIVDGNI